MRQRLRRSRSIGEEMAPEREGPTAPRCRLVLRQTRRRAPNANWWSNSKPTSTTRRSAAARKSKRREALTNKVVGLYNEAEGGKPTKVPTPGAQRLQRRNRTGRSDDQSGRAERDAGEERDRRSPPLVGGVAVQPGSILTYSLTVGNTGTSTAYEVEVTDTNPTANLRNITPVAGAESCRSAESRGSAGLDRAESRSRQIGDADLHGRTGAIGRTRRTTRRSKNAAEVPSYFGLPEAEREAAKELARIQRPESRERTRSRTAENRRRRRRPGRSRVPRTKRPPKSAKPSRGASW